MLANSHSLKKGEVREIVEMSPEILLVNDYLNCIMITYIWRKVSRRHDIRLFHI